MLVDEFIMACDRMNLKIKRWGLFIEQPSDTETNVTRKENGGGEA